MQTRETRRSQTATRLGRVHRGSRMTSMMMAVTTAAATTLIALTLLMGRASAESSAQLVPMHLRGPPPRGPPPPPHHPFHHQSSPRFIDDNMRPAPYGPMRGPPGPPPNFPVTYNRFNGFPFRPYEEEDDEEPQRGGGGGGDDDEDEEVDHQFAGPPHPQLRRPMPAPPQPQLRRPMPAPPQSQQRRPLPAPNYRVHVNKVQQRPPGGPGNGPPPMGHGGHPRDIAPPPPPPRHVQLHPHQLPPVAQQASLQLQNQNKQLQLQQMELRQLQQLHQTVDQMSEDQLMELLMAAEKPGTSTQGPRRPVTPQHHQQPMPQHHLPHPHRAQSSTTSNRPPHQQQQLHRPSNQHTNNPNNLRPNTGPLRPNVNTQRAPHQHNGANQQTVATTTERHREMTNRPPSTSPNTHREGGLTFNDRRPYPNQFSNNEPPIRPQQQFFSSTVPNIIGQQGQQFRQFAHERPQQAAAESFMQDPSHFESLRHNNRPLVRSPSNINPAYQQQQQQQQSPNNYEISAQQHINNRDPSQLQPTFRRPQHPPNGPVQSPSILGSLVDMFLPGVRDLFTPAQGPPPPPRLIERPPYPPQPIRQHIPNHQMTNQNLFPNMEQQYPPPEDFTNVPVRTIPANKQRPNPPQYQGVQSQTLSPNFEQNIPINFKSTPSNWPQQPPKQLQSDKENLEVQNSELFYLANSGDNRPIRNNNPNQNQQQPAGDANLLDRVSAIPPDTEAPTTPMTMMPTTTNAPPISTTKYPYTTRIPPEMLSGVIPYALAYFSPHGPIKTTTSTVSPQKTAAFAPALPTPQPLMTNQATASTLQPMLPTIPTTLNPTTTILPPTATTTTLPQTTTTTLSPTTTTTLLPTTTTTLLPTTTTTLPPTTTTTLPPTTTTTLPPTTTTTLPPTTTTTLPPTTITTLPPTTITTLPPTTTTTLPPTTTTTLPPTTTTTLPPTTTTTLPPTTTTTLPPTTTTTLPPTTTTTLPPTTTTTLPPTTTTTLPPTTTTTLPPTTTTTLPPTTTTTLPPTTTTTLPSTTTTTLAPIPVTLPRIPSSSASITVPPWALMSYAKPAKLTLTSTSNTLPQITTLSPQQQFVSELAIPEGSEMLSLLKTAFPNELQNIDVPVFPISDTTLLPLTASTTSHPLPSTVSDLTTRSSLASNESPTNLPLIDNPSTLSMDMTMNASKQHPYLLVFRTLGAIPPDRRKKFEELFPGLAEHIKLKVPEISLAAPPTGAFLVHFVPTQSTLLPKDLTAIAYEHKSEETTDFEKLQTKIESIPNFLSTTDSTSNEFIKGDSIPDSSNRNANFLPGPKYIISGQTTTGTASLNTNTAPTTETPSTTTTQTTTTTPTTTTTTTTTTPTTTTTTPTTTTTTPTTTTTTPTTTTTTPTTTTTTPTTTTTTPTTTTTTPTTTTTIPTTTTTTPTTTTTTPTTTTTTPTTTTTTPTTTTTTPTTTTTTPTTTTTTPTTTTTTPTTTTTTPTTTTTTPTTTTTTPTTTTTTPTTTTTTPTTTTTTPTTTTTTPTTTTTIPTTTTTIPTTTTTTPTTTTTTPTTTPTTTTTTPTTTTTTPTTTTTTPTTTTTTPTTTTTTPTTTTTTPTTTTTTPTTTTTTPTTTTTTPTTTTTTPTTTTTTPTTTTTTPTTTTTTTTTTPTTTTTTPTTTTTIPTTTTTIPTTTTTIPTTTTTIPTTTTTTPTTTTTTPTTTTTIPTTTTTLTTTTTTKPTTTTTTTTPTIPAFRTIPKNAISTTTAEITTSIKPMLAAPKPVAAALIRLKDTDDDLYGQSGAATEVSHILTHAPKGALKTLTPGSVSHFDNASQGTIQVSTSATASVHHPIFFSPPFDTVAAALANTSTTSTSSALGSLVAWPHSPLAKLALQNAFRSNDNMFGTTESNPLGVPVEEISKDLFSPALAQKLTVAQSLQGGDTLHPIESVLHDSVHLATRLKANMHNLQRLRESFDSLGLPEPSRTWAWRRILHMSVEGIIKSRDISDRLKVLAAELSLAKQGETLLRRSDSHK